MRSQRRAGAVRRLITTLGPVVREAPGEVYAGAELSGSARAAAVGRALCGDSPTEQVWVLLLDGKHRLRLCAQVSVGTLTSSLVHPREVFGPALREGAAAVILVHNHPSGDSEPSQEDVAITRRLLDAGKLLGVPLLDHLIIGAETHASLRECAWWPE